MKLGRFGGWLAVLAVLATSGCATGRYTIPARPESAAIVPDQATLIVMRPSTMAYAIAASVFDITDGALEPIAVLGPKEMVAYRCPPGQRRFMVQSESSDFMEGELKAGRVYYAAVTPRMGAWKARFSIHPFKQQPAEKEFDVNGQYLRDWLRACSLVQKDAARVDTWAAQNRDSIVDRQEAYWGKWQAKPEAEKQPYRFVPEDGVTEPR